MADLVIVKGDDVLTAPTHLSANRLSDVPTTYCGKPVGRVLLYTTTWEPTCPTCAMASAMGYRYVDRDPAPVRRNLG